MNSCIADFSWSGLVAGTLVLLPQECGTRCLLGNRLGLAILGEPELLLGLLAASLEFLVRHGKEERLLPRQTLSRLPVVVAVLAVVH